MPAASTSWDQVAGWYDGWVSQRGSKYHRALAVPTALELLDLRPGEDILDVGAGQGVLADYIAERGARYTGVDSSPRLIAAARRRHGSSGRFLVADARRLDRAGLWESSFDAAVFLLSLQNIDPLDAVFASVSRVLHRRSRLVIVMTHPCFRQPRHSGWGTDEGRKLIFRRIDAYLTPMAVPMQPLETRWPTWSFHRPLSQYVEGLATVGFAIDGMREITDLPAKRQGRSPDRRMGRAAAEIPMFLALRAIRRWPHGAQLDADQGSSWNSGAACV
jgi:ubiquinone/menaquinone biosynthesis C-methylase UbiE